MFSVSPFTVTRVTLSSKGLSIGVKKIMRGTSVREGAEKDEIELDTNCLMVQPNHFHEKQHVSS